MSETAPNRVKTDTDVGRLHPSVGRFILAAGVAMYVAAFAIVIVGNGGQIRYTADGSYTVPVWHSLLPAVVGGTLALLVSPDSRARPQPSTPVLTLRIQAVALLALGLAFTLLLSLVGPDEPRYTLLKLTLLLVAPLMLFAATGRRTEASRRQTMAQSAANRRKTHLLAERELLRPLLPVAGWAITYSVLSANRPNSLAELDVGTLLLALAVGFLANAVLEELFYRKWLQTRWQLLLGGVWPAIVLSSIVWASWHIAIQGQGDLVVDLASVIANQGVTGLFFGLLWSRYQGMWPLLVLHGLMNANPLTLFQVV